MTQTIPKMDQKIINELFPDQVVKTSQRSVQNVVRGYSLSNNHGILIATERGRKWLSAYMMKLQPYLTYELKMKNVNNHLVCVLYP